MTSSVTRSDADCVRVRVEPRGAAGITDDANEGFAYQGGTILVFENEQENAGLRVAADGDLDLMVELEAVGRRYEADSATETVSFVHLQVRERREQRPIRNELHACHLLSSETSGHQYGVPIHTPSIQKGYMCYTGAAIIGKKPMANEQQINVKADDQTLKGVYANSMVAAHTKEEVILDFMSIHPPHGVLVSRVITSPAHLKRIVAALTENLKKYEQAFGPVEPSAEPDRSIGFKA